MKVGQTVYLVPINGSNAKRRSEEMKEVLVKKLGRKYVTVEVYGQFHLCSRLQKTIYSPDYKLYENKDDINLEIEREALISLITNSIPKYGKWDIDINKLRAIASILTKS